jgi:transcriptional regulator with GAF, ATPase, and Fis domain
MSISAKSPQERIKELEHEVAALRAQIMGRGRHPEKSDNKLAQALRDVQNRRNEVEALLEGARSLLIHTSFEQAARGLFDACKTITGATAGYVALLSDSGEENEVLFLDAGGRECTVDPHLPMPIRGLRAESYRDSKAVCDNDFCNSHWQQYLPKGHVTMENVLFAPLIIDKKPVGLIGLANKEGPFTERDLEMATTFGEMASVALRERRAEERRKELVAELQNALTEVRKLSGIVPICMHCKKIRDDAGYWQRVEAYIQSHSEAKFSHGICPDCREEFYPDI